MVLLTKKRFTSPILLFFIVAAVLSALFLVTQHKAIQRNKEKYTYIAINEANKIKNCLDSVMARTEILKSVMIATNGKIETFDLIAEKTYKNTQAATGVALKNIALAPDGIVQKVYPLQGNAGLIGFNFMDSSKPGNLEAIEAYKKDMLVLTNPFNLTQGGIGMAGRLPIFIPTPEGQHFWGLTTVTIDFADFIKTIDSQSLSKQGIQYQLYYIKADGTRVSLDASEKLPVKPVSYELSHLNLKWMIDVAPAAGWINYSEFAVAFIIIFCIALLMSILLKDKLRIKDANETLERIVNLDALTGCYSRQFVNTVLVNPIDGTWNDPEAKFSLAIIDIDYFKTVNDTYGHDVGDQVLIEVSKVLQSYCKHENGDCVIRHGGDEFIVLYNDVTLERFTNKLKNLVTDTRNIHLKDFPNLAIALSIGGILWQQETPLSYYDLTKLADEKLYKAKENGRNQFVI